jgi:hypothetical protein
MPRRSSACQRDTAAALMRCAQEHDAVRRRMDGAIILEGAPSGGVRVNESVHRLVERANAQSAVPLTLYTMMPPRLCVKMLIGRLLVCIDVSSTHPRPMSPVSYTLVICRSRYKSDTSVRAWSNRHWRFTTTRCACSRRSPS